MASLIVLCLTTILGVPRPAFDPSLGWYTLETDHFAIHFSWRGRLTHSRTEFAQEVGNICEEVHSILTRTTGWSPATRTQVIIADFYDYSNGWAAPLPDNTITIIPTPPADSRVNDDNWLRTLIIHEYSHILQLDMARGIFLNLRKVLGRVSLPNALMPAWLSEGYAIYNETRFSSFGRLRSAEHAMMLRAAARSNRLLPIDRCGGYELRRFPGGAAPYLYGSRFLDYLAGISAPDIWDRFNHRHAGLPPFFENAAARRTFGTNFCNLWRAWQPTVRLRAAVTETQITRQPLTRIVPLTNEGFSTRSPCWSHGGGEVYYISETGQEYPVIKAANPATGETRRLHRGLVTGTMSLSPDGRHLAFAEYRLSRNGYLFTDIFALDLVTGRLKRLTRNMRSRDPDFAPDTALLVFVTNHDAQNDLCLLDIKTGTITNLTETQDHTAFHCPRFSPGGRWIAVGVNRPGGYADIELIDRITGWTIPVTHDRATDLSPCWSRTGKTLFFISDRSGVFNLYAYNIESQQLFRCTNVLDGVFEPAVAPDNHRIALVAHSASGDDIGLLGLHGRDWFEADSFSDTLPLVEPTFSQVSSRLYYYNPFPTLWPKFWLPWLAIPPDWEAGAFTLGWDALQYHTYQVAAGYRHAGNTPFLTFSYSLNRYWPSVELSGNLDLTSQFSRFTLSFPFYRTTFQSWLDLSSRFYHDTLTTLSVEGAGTFSNARSYRFCVAPVQGRILGLVAETRSVLSGDNHLNLVAHWTEYFGLPPQTWSLRCRVAAGTAFGTPPATTAFRLDNQPGLFRVRGYRQPGPPGRNIAIADLQLRVPLYWVERGIGTAPVFLQNINAALFCDNGVCWNSNLAPALADTFRTGIGAELRLDFILGRYVPVAVTSGLALGLRPQPAPSWYLSVTSDLFRSFGKEGRRLDRYPRRLPVNE